MKAKKKRNKNNLNRYFFTRFVFEPIIMMASPESIGAGQAK
jgi:hypothetical protein